MHVQGAYAVLMNYMIGPKDVRRHGECDGCSWTMEVRRSQGSIGVAAYKRA